MSDNEGLVREAREQVQVNISIIIEPYPPGGFVAWPEYGEHIRMIAPEKWMAVEKVLSATAAYLNLGED